MCLKDHEIRFFTLEIPGNLFIRGIIFKRFSYYNSILWNLASRKLLYGSGRLWGIDFHLGQETEMKNLHTPRLYIETHYPGKLLSVWSFPWEGKRGRFLKESWALNPRVALYQKLGVISLFCLDDYRVSWPQEPNCKRRKIHIKN